MRELLQQPIAAIEKLPAEVQDAIATRLLAEAADEQAWAAQFEATSDVQWDRMAETVRRAIVAEDITPLKEENSRIGRKFTTHGTASMRGLQS